MVLVVTTSDEKKAPPSLEGLCNFPVGYKLQVIVGEDFTFGITFEVNTLV